jgi:hypothetical protein
LIFKASIESFDASAFHQKCDGIAPTLILVKSNNEIFGGYTD